jgi:hypothetical protein
MDIVHGPCPSLDSSIFTRYLTQGTVSKEEARTNTPDAVAHVQESSRATATKEDVRNKGQARDQQQAGSKQ